MSYETTHNGRRAVKYANRGSFVIVAGINGSYRKNLLDEIESDFEKTGKKIERINFSIKDELTAEENEFYQTNHYKPFIHYRHKKQIKNIADVDYKRSNGINIIGVESGLDMLVHDLEKDNIDESIKTGVISNWIWHQKISKFPQCNVKIILADKRDEKKYNEFVRFIEMYKKEYLRIFDNELNCVCIEVKDKKDKREYERVKKEVYSIMDDKFVEPFSYWYLEPEKEKKFSVR